MALRYSWEKGEAKPPSSRPGPGQDAGPNGQSCSAINGHIDRVTTNGHTLQTDSTARGGKKYTRNELMGVAYKGQERAIGEKERQGRNGQSGMFFAARGRHEEQPTAHASIAASSPMTGQGLALLAGESCLHYCAPNVGTKDTQNTSKQTHCDRLPSFISTAYSR